MKLLLLVLAFVCSSPAQSEGEAETFPRLISRRLSSDFHGNTICDHDKINDTYLVSERKCVKFEELFSGNFI